MKTKVKQTLVRLAISAAPEPSGLRFQGNTAKQSKEEQSQGHSLTNPTTMTLKG